LLPKDYALVGSVVRDICYNNAARYFGFRAPIAGAPATGETK
ncbi:MAG: glucuronate isomerase, partial [Thermogutta sp.]|nr:glucuronate isomerase [Thermogutta sp.]